MTFESESIKNCLFYNLDNLYPIFLIHTDPLVIPLCQTTLVMFCAPMVVPVSILTL